MITFRQSIFIFGPVCTTSKEIENAALFLRLGLLSPLIRHVNGAFRQRSSHTQYHIPDSPEKTVTSRIPKFSEIGISVPFDFPPLISWIFSLMVRISKISTISGFSGHFRKKFPNHVSSGDKFPNRTMSPRELSIRRKKTFGLPFCGNFQWRIEQNFPEFKEKRTNVERYTKMFEISHRELISSRN